MSCSIHQVPGRVRVRSSQIRECRTIGDNVSASLSAIPGVESVHIKPVTGSVLVRYDVETVCSSVIINALAILGVLPGVIGFPGARSLLPLEPARPRLAEAAAPPRKSVVNHAVKVAVAVGLQVALPFILERYLGKATAKLISSVVL